MVAKKYIKIAVESLFIASLFVHTVVLTVIVRTILINSISLAGLGYKYVLSIFLCLAWIGASIWARKIMNKEVKKTELVIWPGLLTVFLSLGLTILGLLSHIYSPVIFTLSALTVAGLNKRIRSVSINIASGIAHAVVLYFQGGIYAAGSVLIVDLLIIAFTILVGGALSEWRKQSNMFDQARWAASEFAHANIFLQDSMSNIEIWTRSKERIRVAREIHDTVGYALTAVLVQLSATQELLKTDPKKTHARLQQLEGLIRTTIQDVRKEVSKLRDSELDQQTWREKWRHLCKVFADFTGIRVHIEISKNLESVDDNLGAILYRIIQEALTNAYRHGRARYVDVAMGFKEKERNILLRISDDGSGVDVITIGSGLKGIYERVENLGGEVVLDTLPEKGFDLGIAIPWKGYTL